MYQERHLVHNIHVSNRCYELNNALYIELDTDNEGNVFAHHESLPVHGYGQNLSEALLEFDKAFDFQWRNLVEVNEESLTFGAIRKRDEMKSIVNKVTLTNTKSNSTQPK